MRLRSPERGANLLSNPRCPLSNHIKTVHPDQLFKQSSTSPAAFSFDESVARVFDDMIQRSIPLYTEVQQTIPALAGTLDHDPLHIVDLGCSTGTTLLHLATQLRERRLRLTGVDNSQPMLDRLGQKFDAMSGIEIELVCADLQSVELRDVSIVVMNYTLQFLPPECRLAMLRRVHCGLRSGGFLILSEKLIHPEPTMNHTWTKLYFDFKRRNGYSELEIARKRSALENVLIPLSLQDNLSLLQSAGFHGIEVLLKWFNFATLIANR